VTARGSEVWVAWHTAPQGEPLLRLTWLREDGHAQSLWLARYSPTLERELGRPQLAVLQGRGRGTGFARLLADDGSARLVWTDVVDGKPQLHGTLVSALPATDKQ